MIARRSPILCIALGVAVLAVAPSARAEAAPAALSVTGEDGKVVVLTVKDLAALPQEAASIAHEGKTTGFKGPSLTEVLKRVGAPLGPALRGPALSDVVIVTASDGYTVALALSDLEPSIRPGKAILADAMADGAPLGADGPFRLVVDGDLKPARSARNVIAIELRRLRAAH